MFCNLKSQFYIVFSTILIFLLASIVLIFYSNLQNVEKEIEKTENFVLSEKIENLHNELKKCYFLFDFEQFLNFSNFVKNKLIAKNEIFEFFVITINYTNLTLYSKVEINVLNQKNVEIKNFSITILNETKFFDSIQPNSQIKFYVNYFKLLSSDNVKIEYFDNVKNNYVFTVYFVQQKNYKAYFSVYEIKKENSQIKKYFFNDAFI